MPDRTHEAAPADGEPTQFRRDDFEADERRIIILMAGVEAEAILTHDEDWWESEEDRRRAEEIITALIASGWLPAARMSMNVASCSAHEDMARRCWSLFQYRTRELLRQPPLQSAVIALANALLAEERIDAARTARIIRTGIAEADPDLIGSASSRWRRWSPLVGRSSPARSARRWRPRRRRACRRRCP